MYNIVKDNVCFANGKFLFAMLPRRRSVRVWIIRMIRPSLLPFSLSLNLPPTRNPRHSPQHNPWHSPLHNPWHSPLHNLRHRLGRILRVVPYAARRLFPVVRSAGTAVHLFLAFPLPLPHLPQPMQRALLTQTPIQLHAPPVRPACLLPMLLAPVPMPHAPRPKRRRAKRAL